MKVADTRGFTFKAFKHLKGNLKLCIHQSVSLTVLYCIVDNMLTILTIFTLLTLSVKTLETSKKQYQALIQAISKSLITDRLYKMDLKRCTCRQECTCPWKDQTPSLAHPQIQWQTQCWWSNIDVSSSAPALPRIRSPRDITNISAEVKSMREIE